MSYARRLLPAWIKKRLGVLGNVFAVSSYTEGEVVVSRTQVLIAGQQPQSLITAAPTQRLIVRADET